jgi:hypothetical protein
MAAGRHEREHDVIAGRDARDARAHLFDDARRFVSEHDRQRA